MVVSFTVVVVVASPVVLLGLFSVMVVVSVVATVVTVEIITFTYYIWRNVYYDIVGYNIVTLSTPNIRLNEFLTFSVWLNLRKRRYYFGLHLC